MKTTDSVLEVNASRIKIDAKVNPAKFLNRITMYKEVSPIAKEKISLCNVVEYTKKIGRKLTNKPPINANKDEKKVFYN